MGNDEAGGRSRFDDLTADGRRESAGFFRGAELPRLLLLLVIVVAGWVLVWNYLHRSQEPPDEPEPAARGAPARVEPVASPAFESVTDRTPLTLRDTAAYDLLLQRARKTDAGALASQSHSDIYFTHLWERPEHYRGVPVHLLGTARRIITNESKLSPQGQLYEAWITTHESQGHPYVCVFEELPKGMPIGPDVSERVVFNGYFLKNMRYLAGRDIPRAAPLLVGRIGWTPGRPARRDNSVFWMALAVGVMFVISFYRWIAGLRRSLSRRTRPSTLLDRPNEEIAPEDLAHWVDSVRDEDSRPGSDADPERDGGGGGPGRPPRGDGA